MHHGYIKYAIFTVQTLNSLLIHLSQRNELFKSMLVRTNQISNVGFEHFSVKLNSLDALETVKHILEAYLYISLIKNSRKF